MIQFQNISKAFGGVRVLRDVSFEVLPGRTLGLVGENGAGKSTLMNILGGNLRQTSGSMLLGGRPYAPGNPIDATHAGVAFIHQELNLFPNISIAENIFLTTFPTVAGCVIDRPRIREQTTSLLKQAGLQLSPDVTVDRLSTGECQLVEIAKALATDARLIILDEPTSSLSARETEILFALMADLKARGISLIFISHNLADILRLADDIVVLRDGEVVDKGLRADFSAERMISLMVGRSLTQLFPPRNGKVCEEVVLEARGLSQPGVVKDITLNLNKGEILGIFGLMGAGRSELARILFGLDPCQSGEIFLNGKPLRRADPRRRIRSGMAFLTESRREDGLCLEASIADNIALVSLRQHSRPPLGLLKHSPLREAVMSIRRAVRLTPSARDAQAVKTLSGGNQQKVVLAKWLLARPAVLILDEPTRGIDVGAKFEIYQLINELADNGAGVAAISSELEELIGICDRIVVLNRGEVRGSFSRPGFNRESILAAALGSRPEQRAISGN